MLHQLFRCITVSFFIFQAYMEDHLTNKARLDTEWAALCAYDADPCSVAIAQLVS